jgi:oligoribonuclease NrnB/cAMP/cGMP phosphodiesterase (DHH superfamily)
MSAIDLVNSDEQIHVLYHGPGCLDGFGASYAAWVKFGDNATYTPVSYVEGEAPLAAVPDRAYVYVLDFSFKADVLNKHMDRFSSFLLLDHHKTAFDDLDDEFANDARVIIDMDMSGATLAWEYFHTEIGDHEAIPRLLRAVEDRDLWKFKLPFTREAMAALRVEEKDFRVWDEIVQGGDDAFNKLVDKGRVLTRADFLEIERLAEGAFELEFEGHKIRACNTSHLQSEVGNRMMSMYDIPFSLCFTIKLKADGWWMQGSLRSSKDKTDVSLIAQTLGGGGHFAAAGFNKKISWAFS